MDTVLLNKILGSSKPENDLLNDAVKLRYCVARLPVTIMAGFVKTNITQLSHIVKRFRSGARRRNFGRPLTKRSKRIHFNNFYYKFIMFVNPGVVIELINNDKCHKSAFV
jgi:hypothetical protein